MKDGSRTSIFRHLAKTSRVVNRAECGVGLIGASCGREFVCGSRCERSERFRSRVVRGSVDEHVNPFGGRAVDGSATGRYGRADRRERRAPSFSGGGVLARGGGPPVAENAVVGARIYPEPGSVAADVDALGDFTQIPVVRPSPSPSPSLRSCCERSEPSRLSPPQRKRPAGKGRPLGEFGGTPRMMCFPNGKAIKRARGR